MNLNAALARLAAGLLVVCVGTVLAEGEIYKVVDAEGNVTYTDQVPGPGAAPMVLPELSVVDTDYAPETPPEDAGPETSDAAADEETTPRALRKAYRDFAITQPAQEETFWGTENTVVISWSSEKPLLPDMTVRLFIDGQAVSTGTDTMYAATLDRGEHSVYAQLLDGRGRRVLVTPTVVFFVKQHSIAGDNAPRPTPRNGP